MNRNASRCLLMGTTALVCCAALRSAASVAPTTEPVERGVSLPGYNFGLRYSTEKWRPQPSESPQRLMFLHRQHPLALTIMAEKIELTNDVDAVTLAKIFKANREVEGRFEVIREVPARAHVVDGIAMQVLQTLKTGKKAYQLHWTACFNGEIYQVLVTGMEADEYLVRSEGALALKGFHVGDPERRLPLVRDADVPRSFTSGYAYRVDLPDERWVVGYRSEVVPGAQYVAHTRNQGGLLVMPICLLGRDVPSPAVFHGLIGDLTGNSSFAAALPPQKTENGFDIVSAEFHLPWRDEEVGKYLLRLRRKGQFAWLTMTWVNTNANLPADILEQWQKLVTFTPDTQSRLPDTRQFSRRERLAHGMVFTGIGEYHVGREDFPAASRAFWTALDCAYRHEILALFVVTDLQRKKPLETLKSLDELAAFAHRDTGYRLERAYVQAAAGDTHTALVDYSKVLTSESVGADSLPERHFREYIRCAVKEGRQAWAVSALTTRMRDDESPEWRTLLEAIQGTGSKPASPGTAAPSAGNSPGASPDSRPALVAAPGTTGRSITAPLKLQGVFYNAKRPAAIIGGKRVEPGDTVSGYRVESISTKSVTLRSAEGETRVLTLK